MKIFPDFSFEEKYGNKGYTIIGIDEVGRGCLAGPVTVGAVCINTHIIDKQKWLSYGINDSKQITPLQREQLAVIVKKQCLYSTSFIAPQHINSHGIVHSVVAGISNVVLKCKKSFPDNKIILLIDGLPISHIPYINDIQRVSIVKGDGKSISIAAASIIAKVERDEYMNELSKQYPHYAWDENKGYGTVKHRNAIKQYGVTSHHRNLFVRNILKT